MYEAGAKEQKQDFSLRSEIIHQDPAFRKITFLDASLTDANPKPSLTMNQNGPQGHIRSMDKVQSVVCFYK
ncbi:hypothetical protein STEG23_030313 [Scotinomys teguina]